MQINTSLLITILAGFSAGSIHVLTGPDHLAAVAPLAVQRRTRSWVLGLRWGLGHASGVCLVTLIGILLKSFIDIEKLSQISERLVGVLLIGIGIWGIKKAYQITIHTHSHEGVDHNHPHIHTQDSEHGNHTHTALGIGILHGLAGASHFLGVLPALAMPTKFLSVLYISFFGLGTIVSMISFSEIMGRLALKSGVYLKKMMYSFSTAALMVGLYWLI